MIELWVEGFYVQGQAEAAKARRLGLYRGPDYANGVMQFLELDWDAAKQGHLGFANGKFTLYGCKIFDNESDARKSFG